MILRALFLLLATVSLSAAAKDAKGVPAPESKYIQLVGRADSAITDARWKDAADLLNEAMRLEPANPSNVLLMSNLGMVQFYSGNDSLAIETLTTAHNIAPASVTVLQNRARVYTTTGRLKRALGDYSEILRLDSTLIEPRFYRAMLMFNSGDVATAEDDLQYLKRHYPTDPSTKLLDATVLTYTGRFKEAIPLLTEIIAGKPTAGDYSMRALCYLMTNQLQEASDDIQRGLEKDPVDGELYLYRALLNQMRYRPDDARADAALAVKHGVNSLRVKALGLM